MILFTGCITEKTERSTRYRIIKNTTDHNVELIIITNESNSYNLAKGDSIVFEGYCETGFGDFCFIPWDENSPISGKLVFDNKREIIYVSSDCESGRNPLGRIRSSPLCSYLVRSIDGRREYIYYIDDSDYDRAVPIED
jgi:hypothetical protein